MQYLPSDYIRFREDRKAVVYLDQTALPNREIWKETDSLTEMYQAIKKLEVRGAPAIGIFAGYCMAVLAKGYYGLSGEAFLERLRADAAYLDSSRPTAVNLGYALKRMNRTAARSIDQGKEALLRALDEEAVRIHEEDISMCRKMGEYGITLLKDGDGLLTHCNAGPLATSRYGTQLSPVFLGQERGMHFHMYVDETRPLLQGARLTTWELMRAGIDTTLICDNMAGLCMKQGKIQAVLTGCDRVAANGDAANKIGTSSVAVLASYYHIPLYIFCPATTFDPDTATGDDIVIEERDPEEIRSMHYAEPKAPEGIKCYNPAFDVTDHSLISAFVTDRGIIRPPYDVNLKVLLEGRK